MSAEDAVIWVVIGLSYADLTKQSPVQLVMALAGVAFIIGAIIMCAAQDIAMLIIGRVVLGVGVGAGTMVSYLSSNQRLQGGLLRGCSSQAGGQYVSGISLIGLQIMSATLSTDILS